MGLLDATFDSIEGMLFDQWKDIVTTQPFDERVVVAPGIRKRTDNGFGNNYGSDNILTNGSIILVPENTAAFVFSQAGIEQVITTPGGFEYRDGETSVLDKQDRREQGIGKILLGQAADRFVFSGMPSEEKRVAFVNLREIRGLRFGTRGALAYNDRYYATDLELYAYGMFSVRVVDPTLFIQNFVPAGVTSYSLDEASAREQLLAEFLHSFTVAANALSENYRISQLPSQVDAIAREISGDSGNVGTWEQRFGLTLSAIAIENIELSEASRQLVQQFAEKRMGVRAFEDVSQGAADIAAQQMIAQGVRDNGLGDGGGMLFGMNLAGGLNPTTAGQVSASPTNDGNATAPSFDMQIDMVKKLKELSDAGIITQEEFELKKKEILGL